MNDLSQIWNHIAGKYSTDLGQVETFWSEIVISYSDPARVYHNLDHIQYLIDHAFEFENNIENFDAIVMAIVYHDITYNIERKDNEESSAALAKFRLGEMGFRSHVIDRCVNHILATKEHLPSDDPDTNFMIDFDLAILGESTQGYESYKEKILREYSIIPQEEFNKGRADWITSFLKRERIFVTDECYERYEERARGNLQRELLRLRTNDEG